MESGVSVLSHERVTGKRILRIWSLRGREPVKWEREQNDRKQGWAGV